MPLQRTPPESPAQHRNPVPSSCIDCDAPDTERMVACDDCDSWTHFDCAGVDDSIGLQDRPFKCSNCTSTGATANLPPVTQINAVTHPPIPTTTVVPITYAPFPYTSTTNPTYQQYRFSPSVTFPSSDDESETVRKMRADYERRLKVAADEQERHSHEMRELRHMMQKLTQEMAELKTEKRTLEFQLRKKAEDNLNETFKSLSFPQTGTTGTPLTSGPNQNNWNATTWPPSAQNVRRSFLTPSGLVSNTTTVPTIHNSTICTNVLQPGTIATSAVNMPYTPGRPSIINPTGTAPYEITHQQMAARKTMKTDLIKFEGKPETWPAFISFYEETSAACGFTNQENLVRLMNSLAGKARTQVLGLLTVPNNVPYIIERLQALYGRPEQIIESQLADVRKLPVLTMEKIDTLIDYGVAVHNLVSTMKATQMNGYLASPTVLIELVDRLPTMLRMQWAAYARIVPYPDLTLFDSWLDAITLDACRISAFTSPEPRKKEPRPRVNMHDETNSSSDKSQSDRVRECPVCHKSCNHVPDCPRFKNANRNGRWDIVRSARLCRQCLRQHRGSCRTPTRCEIDGCDRPHHPLLHPIREEKQTPPEQEPPTSGQSDAKKTPEQHMTHQARTDSTLFRVIPIRLRHETNIIDTYAFLDDGSSITLLDSTIAEELNLKGPTKPLCLQWTSEQSRTEENSQMVSVSVSGACDTDKSFTLQDVRTVTNLSLPRQTIDMTELAERYPHLKGLPLRSYEDARPMILIGLDNSHVSSPLRLKEGCRDDPVAVKSRLGWSVYGKISKGTSGHASLNIHASTCQGTTDLLKNALDLDGIGIVRQSRSLLTPEEKRADDIMKSTTIRISDRYETGLLWPLDDVQLPNNRSMALKRTKCLEARFEADPELAENLNAQIEEMKQANFTQELLKAETYLFKQAQQEEYADELQRLQDEGQVAKTSKLYKLSPYLDDAGMIRHETRLRNALPPMTARNPIILPRSHPISQLMVQRYHERLLHAQSETVVNELRQRFYIAKIRRVVQRVAHMCQYCLVKKAMPAVPRMAPLPLARIAVTCPPFTHAGVDYFGPIYVTVRRSSEKRWGVLFTCLSSRAIHLEIATSLNISSCILAITSFMGRRGTPKAFYSDRGTNFIGSERILQEELRRLNSEELAESVVSPTLEWKFNPPLAPHMGGAWERLVRTVKSALYAALPQRNTTEEILRATLVEIENMKETNTWHASQHMANRFWKRWLAEYLPEITMRSKWLEAQPPVKVDDVVIVIDPEAKRNEWKKGRVIQTHKGPDGQVRSAKVVTTGGILTRPVTKLAVLRIKSSNEDSFTGRENVTKTTPQSESGPITQHP